MSVVEIRRLRWALGALAAILAAAWQTPAAAALTGPVRLASGLVTGVPGREPSISAFRGIPYAAPPIGALRWKPPQPPAHWQGVRKADAFGPMCPQMQRGTPQPMSEDCLSLNVWTGAASDGERRPVFVWIYGGGGYSSDPLYDGEGLARKGMVVVTFNYLQGILGSLSTPELTAESPHHASGNYGHLEQVAVLEWVQQNIAAFGGDPGNVTIAGQSMGAASVLHLIDSPLAHGLFRQAIAESGARYPHDPEQSWLAEGYSTLEFAEHQGADFMSAHGVHSIKDLRAVSVEQLLAWSNRAGGGGPRGSGQPGFRSVLDGWFMPQSYAQARSHAPVNDVPLITGNNFDESGAETGQHITLADYQANAQKKFGVLATEYLRLYPATSDEQATAASVDAARDESRVSTYLWAQAWHEWAKSPLYTYCWTRVPPGPEATRGAYHGSEINYVLDNFYGTDWPWTDEDRHVAQIMSGYVLNLATHGDPNGAGLPPLPAFDPRSGAVTELGNSWQPTPVADPVILDFWRRFFLSQPAW